MVYRIRFPNRYLVLLICLSFFLEACASLPQEASSLKSSTDSVIATSKAFVGQFENASTLDTVCIANNGEPYPPRINRHSDESIRIRYPPSPDNFLIWYLIRRDASGNWAEKALELATDDVALPRHARDDQAYVL